MGKEYYVSGGGAVFPGSLPHTWPYCAPPPAPPHECGALGWALVPLLGLHGALTLGRAMPLPGVKAWRLRSTVVGGGWGPAPPAAYEE